jgi:hypothetical protein
MFKSWVIETLFRWQSWDLHSSPFGLCMLARRNREAFG